jgi:hypothetical protein
VTLLRSLLLLVAPTRLAAQTTVPVSREPRHHFQFANHDLRVYDVVVPPGDTTFYHVHAVDYTYVSFGAANLVAQVQGNDAAPLVLRDGEVRFARGPLTHRVWNTGTAPFHNLTIELLRRDSTASITTTTPGSPGDSVMLDNNRVRVVRHVIAPGGSDTLGQGGHVLDVYLSDGEAWITTGARKAVAMRTRTAMYRWYGSTGLHTVRNAGTLPLTLLTFQVK